MCRQKTWVFFVNRQQRNNIINKTNTKVQFPMQHREFQHFSAVLSYNLVYGDRVSHNHCSRLESSGSYFPSWVPLYLETLVLVFSFGAGFDQFFVFCPLLFFTDFLFLVSVINTLVSDIVRYRPNYLLAL